MRPGRTAAAKAADHKKAHSVGGQILWEVVKYVVPALLALIFKFVSDTKSDVEDLKRTVVQIAWQQEQIKDIRASNTDLKNRLRKMELEHALKHGTKDKSILLDPDAP